MSQNTTDESQSPTEQPTGADLIGKITDATEVLIEAQEKLVKAVADVAKHTTDPNAHGAATLANIAKAMPTPVLEDGMFTFKDAAGKPLMEPVNIKGDPGNQGEKGNDGEKGDMPDHRWNGTALQIQNPDGTWGEEQNLQGPKGIDGADGEPGLAPAHEWNGTSLKFKNPDGSWGEEQNLQGPKGIDGADGEPGLAPAHEWNGTSLKFKNPDGTWGEEQDLQGPQGAPGDAAIATAEQPGIMQPDGATTEVDDDGLLTALGGNLQINSDELIEESCEWTAPVSGWFKVLIVDGGASGWAGGDSTNVRALGGRSGARKWHTAYFRKGDKIDVIVGAGGVISASATNVVTGGHSYFGSLSSGGGLDFYNTSSPNMAIKSIAFMDAPGAGPGGGSYSPGNSPTTAGYHYASGHNGYRGGGGGARVYNQSGGSAWTVGNGGNGYIYIMWHDPAKAAGPVVAPALLAARRMAAPRAADAPVTVNLYDPETGQGSVWREEDAEAKLAEGLISESAWMEIRAARAAEERAEWLTSPATSAERFAMLRAAREVRLAEYDTTVAQLRREERAGEDVTAALAAWDAYAEALCDLPAQAGAPWDGGDELTPWPEIPTVSKVQTQPEAAVQTEEPEV